MARNKSSGETHISQLGGIKVSQPKTYFSAALRVKWRDGKHAGFFKDEIQQGCLHTARPGEPAGQSIPWEMDGQGGADIFPTSAR